MSAFGLMIEPLSTGKSIRRSKWHKTTELFVQHACVDYLVTRSHNGPAVEFQLSWKELNADDWSVVK